MRVSSKIFSVFVIIFTGCIPGDYKISASENADYKIAVGENFKVELVSNPTTGYSWRWVNKETVSIVDSVGFDYSPEDDALVGSGGKEIWKFKGVKTGVDTLKLEYCRVWDPTSTVDSMRIVVRVD